MFSSQGDINKRHTGLILVLLNELLDRKKMEEERLASVWLYYKSFVCNFLWNTSMLAQIKPHINL